MRGLPIQLNDEAWALKQRGIQKLQGNRTRIKSSPKDPINHTHRTNPMNPINPTSPVNTLNPIKKYKPKKTRISRLTSKVTMAIT